MPKNRSWTDEELIVAVANSYSFRMTIKTVGLIPAGGNYAQITKKIKELELDTSHFTGSRWNVGARRKQTNYGTPIEDLLVNDSTFQSYKLKNRLFRAKLKKPKCELCGWANKAPDGRVPVELDHVNGNHADNRLENLRILCPNCHSLQPTHRGKNKRARLARVVE